MMTPDEMREVAALHNRVADLLSMVADAREHCDREVEAHHSTRSSARQEIRDMRARADKAEARVAELEALVAAGGGK